MTHAYTSSLRSPARRGLGHHSAGDTVAKHRRMFNGYWNPERRLLRMTKEQGTLPSLCNSFVLRPGGAKDGLFAAAVMLSVFVAFTRFVGRL